LLVRRKFWPTRKSQSTSEFSRRTTVGETLLHPN
jgi:hypothetical protein